MTQTAFGPQGLNAATTLPAGTANNKYGSGVDTWVQDCGTAANSTILDAAFFNVIIGNLRNVIKQAIADGAPITLADGNMNMLADAIKWSGTAYDAVNQVGEGLSLVGTEVRINVPALKVMTA